MFGIWENAGGGESWCGVYVVKPQSNCFMQTYLVANVSENLLFVSVIWVLSIWLLISWLIWQASNVDCSKKVIIIDWIDMTCKAFNLFKGQKVKLTSSQVGK